MTIAPMSSASRIPNTAKRYHWTPTRHCTSRRSSFTRSSRRPHRFRTLAAEDVEVHYDFGRLDPPDELHLDVRGWMHKRIEAYWNGCIFVGEDVPAPGATFEPGG